MVLTFSFNIFASSISSDTFSEDSTDYPYRSIIRATICNNTPSRLSVTIYSSQIQPYQTVNSSYVVGGTGELGFYFRINNVAFTYYPVFYILVDGNPTSWSPEFSITFLRSFNGLQLYEVVSSVSQTSGYLYLYFNPSTLTYIEFSDIDRYKPFYQPFLDFNNQVISNTWSFFGDLFGDSYLNLTIFIAGLFFILLAIMIVYLIFRRATHLGG